MLLSGKIEVPECIAYTTPCGMYQIVEKDGLFYPQERRVLVPGWGRLYSQQEVEEFRASGHWTIQEGPFEGWFLGRTCRGESKGYKRFKSERAAINFVDGCSAQLQEAAC
jgi:hypothetical protein